MKISRQTVDLSAYPDLVVIYLGMRVNRMRGIAKLIALGPKIQASVDAQPEGLLLHERLIYSLFPLHVGMRQYWRDFESLEAWTRSLPHRQWWSDFLRDPGGTGFWHEAYFRRGGMEAIYDAMPAPLGLLQFAAAQPARGTMFSARNRARVEGESGAEAAPVSEHDLG